MEDRSKISEKPQVDITKEISALKECEEAKLGIDEVNNSQKGDVINNVDKSNDREIGYMDNLLKPKGL